jgi:O-antigen/teichoic acid export membrane protein
MPIEAGQDAAPMGRLAGLRSRLDIPLLAAAVATSGVKVASAALNYLFLILLARLMTVDGFGLYGVLFSAATLAAAVLTFGQPVFVLKSIPQFEALKDEARKKGVLLFGLRVLAGTSLVFLLVLGGAYEMRLLPSSLLVTGVLVAFALLTLVYAFSDYACNVLRALGQAYAGLVPRDIAWRLLTCLGVVVLARYGEVSLLNVLLLLAVTLVVLVGWQARRIGGLILRMKPVLPVVETGNWAKASTWMAIGSLLYVASMTVDTVIVGATLGAEDAAIYFAAARTAAISSLLLVGLRLIAAPVFAKLHYGAEPEALQARIEMVYGLSAVTALALGVLGYLLAPYIIQLFGADYAEGVTPFRILLIGLAVATAGGMSASILESTGGERLNALVLLATQSATALAIVFGALHAGLYGAAIAKAAGVAIEALILTACVFHRLRTSKPRGVGTA